VIDTFNSPDKTQEEVSVNQTYIPDEASEKERAIHKFLDSMGIHSVNVQNYIQDQNRLESPNVRLLFQIRNNNLNMN
jgi:hypothetical protein